MQTTHTTNGHNRTALRRRLIRTDQTAGSETDPLRFCAADSERFGLIHRLAMPAFLIGLGTTGTAVVQTLLDILSRELGQCPRSVACLLIDAANECPEEYKRHFLSIGKDGAGTNPHNGRRLFRAHRQQIEHAVNALIEKLSAPGVDLLIPEKTARQATSFYIVAGSGGTSGGALQGMIDLVHKVAERRSIQEPRVHVVLIGPSMPLSDVSRQPSNTQFLLIHNTFAENLTRIYRDMTRSERIWAIYNVDQTNGSTDFSRTDELVAMLGLAMYQLIFTESNSHFMQRVCDADGTGDTGRQAPFFK